MRISEIFYSVQGEGMLIGMPSVFVRTSSCNLRCSFCDTPYTSWKPEGESITTDAIVHQVKQYGCSYIVVTGGEPFISPDIEGLCRELHDSRFHITVETAATVYKPIAADLISLSPKLSNSTPTSDPEWQERHDRDRINLDVIGQFLQRYECQFKFVIDRPEDVLEVKQLLSVLPRIAPERIFLMPQAVDPATLSEKGRWIADLCKKEGFRFGPRLHIDLWGNVRGK